MMFFPTTWFAIRSLRYYLWMIFGFVALAFVEPAKGADPQQLVGAEYFWDIDPGQGNGINVTIPAVETLTSSNIPTINASITNLSTGIHRFGFRVQDMSGRWSDISWEPIQVQDAASLIAGVTNWTVGDSNKFLTQAEYFWDSDPGLGTGTSLNIANAETFTLGGTNSTNINVAQLAPGVHQLGVRAKDAGGRWSAINWMPLLSSDPPVITNQPQSQIASAGATPSFTVGVSGTAPFSYQWSWNGTNLLGATNQTLSLTNVQFASTGAYSLSITNIYGTVTSSVANLTVTLGSPILTSSQGSGTISILPATNDYFLGQQVTLTASAARWYQFVQWSDGVTNNPRTISVGLTNLYTAIFTNTVPLEPVVYKQWERDFGGSGLDNCGAIQQTQDGGYILGGTSPSGISGSKTATNYGGNDFWIIKLDALGTEQWERSYGGTNDDSLSCLQQTADGGYLLSGSSSSGISGSKTTTNYGASDAWVIKLDANGNKVWEKTFGGSGDDVFSRVQLASDGSYVFAGSSSSGVSGNKTSASFGGQDYWLVKLDLNGNKIWEQSFGGASDDIFTEFQQTTDGGFILGG